MYIYPAIIHEEDGFWIEFPDLEGCQTAGETLEETMSLAEEALGLYIASRIENGLKIPAPSALKELDPNGAQTSYVCTDIEPYLRRTRAIKKMVSLPEWLAKEAEKNDISLSKTLQDALKVKLGIS